MTSNRPFGHWSIKKNDHNKINNNVLVFSELRFVYKAGRLNLA